MIQIIFLLVKQSQQTPQYDKRFAKRIAWKKFIIAAIIEIVLRKILPSGENVPRRQYA